MPNESFLLPPESEIPPEQLKAINKMRTISYVLPYSMLVSSGNLLVRTQFKVGSKAVKNLVMIEKHFYKGQKIKEYEFRCAAPSQP